LTRWRSNHARDKSFSYKSFYSVSSRKSWTLFYKKIFNYVFFHKYKCKFVRRFLFLLISLLKPVLPELFFQKSPVLAIFCQKRAFCRHHPCFIAFLCGNVLEKYRQMAKIGDFAHFSVLQNRRFGDKSPLLAILIETLANSWRTFDGKFVRCYYGVGSVRQFP